MNASARPPIASAKERLRVDGQQEAVVQNGQERHPYRPRRRQIPQQQGEEPVEDVDELPEVLPARPRVLTRTAQARPG